VFKQDSIVILEGDNSNFLIIVDLISYNASAIILSVVFDRFWKS
jgi:hypothetical protein